MGHHRNSRIAAVGFTAALMAGCSDDGGAHDASEQEASAAGGDVVSVAADLGGEQVVPASGHPEASGRANVTIDVDQHEICTRLELEGLGSDTVMIVHLHQGEAGEQGPILMPLAPPGANTDEPVCLEAAETVVDAVLENPRGHYVNVRTEEFPGGAARGQIVDVG